MYRNYIKRILDIVLTVIVSPVICVLLLIMAVILRMNLGKGVILRQKRYGRHKKQFTIYKLRTMAKNAPVMSTKEMVERGIYDRHTTRFSRFLRKSSLDELPQFLNILKGDMSMVGPRPVIIKEKELIKARDKYGANDCRPGVTGLAQITGMDYDMSVEEKAAIDGAYADSVSSGLDFKCMVATVAVVLRGGSGFRARVVQSKVGGACKKKRTSRVAKRVAGAATSNIVID